MSGRKQKEIKKAQYYVWYLGWRECRGVWGREFTEPIARDLIQTRLQEELPKLTLEVSKRELKIIQLVEKKKGKVEKIKYPPIPAKDVTYSVQVLSPDEDVVACIYLGYNPQTRCAVHVHVYRCDSAETADILVNHLNQLIELPEHQQRAQKIEAELVAKGQVIARPKQYTDRHSDGQSTTRSGSSDGDPTHSEVNNIFKSQTSKNDNENIPGPHDLNLYDSLAAELRAKLNSRDNQPILLPPKDYDTIHRTKGKLLDLDDRKATNEKVVGNIGAGEPWSFNPIKDTGDSARGDSDAGSLRNSYNGDKSGSQVAQAITRMPYPDISVEEDEAQPKSRNSYHSGGIPDDPYASTDETRNPLYARHTLAPPVARSPRPTSPSRRDQSPRGGERSARGDYSPRLMRHASSASPLPHSREMSPMRYNPNPTQYASGIARATSPPPELRNSYFPKSSLPNYLASEGDIYGQNQSRSGAPKYTASSLGLTDRPSIKRNPLNSRDEGYRSMDRNASPLSGHNYYESSYGSPRELDYTTSMPAAMNYAHYRHGEPVPVAMYHDDMPPTDYPIRDIPSPYAAAPMDFLP